MNGNSNARSYRVLVGHGIEARRTTSGGETHHTAPLRRVDATFSRNERNSVAARGTGPVPQVYSYNSSQFPTYVAQGLVMKQLLDLTANHPHVPFEILEVFFPPGESSDIHSKPCYEIMYVVEGTLGLTSGGRNFVAKKYCGIVIPPGVKHQHKNLGEEMLRFVMIHLATDGYPNPDGAVRTVGKSEVIFFGHRGLNIQSALEGPVNVDM